MHMLATGVSPGARHSAVVLPFAFSLVSGESNTVPLTALRVQGFVKSWGMILASEIGDKTFFIAAIMAMKNPRHTVRAAPGLLPCCALAAFGICCATRHELCVMSTTVLVLEANAGFQLLFKT